MKMFWELPYWEQKELKKRKQTYEADQLEQLKKAKFEYWMKVRADKRAKEYAKAVRGMSLEFLPVLLLAGVMPLKFLAVLLLAGMVLVSFSFEMPSQKFVGTSCQKVLSGGRRVASKFSPSRQLWKIKRIREKKHQEFELLGKLAEAQEKFEQEKGMREELEREEFCAELCEELEKLLMEYGKPEEVAEEMVDEIALQVYMEPSSLRGGAGSDSSLDAGDKDDGMEEL